MKNLASASKYCSSEGKPDCLISQLSCDEIKFGLKKVECYASNVFAYLETAARNAIFACVMEIGKNSYFHNRPVTLPSSVTLTEVKSGFIKGGTNVFLNDFSEVDGKIWKDIQFQNHAQRVFADTAFGLISLKQFNIVLVVGDDKLCWFAQVLFLLQIGIEEIQQEFAVVKYFEITAPLNQLKNF